jgi:hypothetical protein
MSIICSVIRLFVPGWVLILFFWIIIPYYVIHFGGLIKTYNRNGIKSIDRILVIISSIFIIILTIVQYDCADNRCYFLMDALYSMMTSGHTFMPEPKGDLLSLPVIILMILDSIINIYLLVIARKSKKMDITEFKIKK